jgi:[acyl-carrier-protein] S-malonyltransferase
VRVAFLFPGQGAQAVGMGRAICAADPLARQAFDAAAAASGLDLERLCAQGPAEALAATEVTQPAILAVSLAVLAALRGRGLEPAAAAGLSLGEYTALCAAGAAEPRDMAPLVRRRGRYMQEAVPRGAGGMAAVLGLGAEGVHALCAAALAAVPEPPPPGGWVLAPANWNCPGQVVIAGHAEPLREAVACGRAFGARRVVPLPVSAPFHCRLMEPAARRLGPELAALPLRPAGIPVVCNVSGEVVREPEEVRSALLEQCSRPVLWEDSVRRLAALGCDAFVEVGPGQALTGFVQRILPGAPAFAVSDPESLERCLEGLRAA